MFNKILLRSDMTNSAQQKVAEVTMFPAYKEHEQIDEQKSIWTFEGNFKGDENKLNLEESKRIIYELEVSLDDSFSV